MIAMILLDNPVVRRPNGGKIFIYLPFCPSCCNSSEREVTCFEGRDQILLSLCCVRNQNMAVLVISVARLN